MTTISIIIPSFLGDYPGAAKLREYKLKRAISSALNQQCNFSYEIIVISDNCFKTNSIIHFDFLNEEKIKLIKLPKKQTVFSGIVRDAGLLAAAGEKICYLDSDDQLQSDHLQKINDQFEDNDFVFFNDTLFYGRDGKGERVMQVRDVNLQPAKIGTSSIAHLRTFKNGYRPSWAGCDGYGHDYRFIQRLMANTQRHQKINAPGYLVCHVPDLIDS